MDLRRVERNIAANEAYVKENYPNEIFISDTAQLQAINRYSRGLVIPENVKIAKSRAPISPDQRNVLRKELRQAEILVKFGNSVFIVPEYIGYKKRPKDAVVNGELFEFRTVTGNAKTFEWEFRDAKRKGVDTNVYINILSDISKDEVRRRIGVVIRRHPEYTGHIVMSFDDGENTYFWDTGSFR